MKWKLEDHAHGVVSGITQAMIANQVPVDSCLLAAELGRAAGRELGYRSRVVPVRVTAEHEDGRKGRPLGYAEAVDDDRYNGHVITVMDVAGLDPTAPQIHPEIPPLVFEVPRNFGPGDTAETTTRGGWKVTYEAFDDKGDWARDLDGDSARDGRRIGRLLADRVRRYAHG